MRRLLIVFAIALYTGHAIAKPQTQCENAPAARPAAAYAAKQSLQPVAVETPIWKTITVGGSKGVNAIRIAIETAPCPMAIGDQADEALGRPAFPFFKMPFELDLGNGHPDVKVPGATRFVFVRPRPSTVVTGPTPPIRSVEGLANR